MARSNENYWFKRRRYGYGWTPSTPQGWAVIALYVAIDIIAAVAILPVKPHRPTVDQRLLFMSVFVIGIIVLVTIALIKGPTPHWRWGKTSHDNPREDF